jgi:hypothetical protein
MERLVVQSGFKVKNKILRKFEYRFTDAEAFFNYPMIKFHFLPPWKEIIPAQRVEEIFEQLEIKLNEIALKEKQIVMTIPYVCFDCEKSS